MDLRVEGEVAYPTSHGNFVKFEEQLPQKSVGWQMANSPRKGDQQFLRFNQKSVSQLSAKNSRLTVGHLLVICWKSFQHPIL